MYKDIGKLIERRITPRLDDESLILCRDSQSEMVNDDPSSDVYQTRASNTHREGETRRPSRALYITNAKSIVHFVAATRPVFVSSPARGHREV